LLAGPGTGKTLTLTKRIVRLLSEDVNPLSILAFTFTRFAAGELRKRVQNELAEEEESLPRISTLHSYALRELLRNASRTKLPQPLRIADDWEEEEIIIQEMQAILGAKKKGVRELFFKLSADWQQLTADRKDWERTFPDPKFLGTWREHREIYGYTLRAELVYQLKTSLQEEDLGLEGPPRQLLVDEYQDLNPCDLEVVRQLASRGCEIYAAGDDDQSIYGFRQAEPEGIRKFPDEFKPSKKLELRSCKRCDKAILDLGLYVARQDPRRIEKPLEPATEGLGEVKLLRFPDGANEALGIGEICQWLVKRKKVEPHDVLILLRSDRRKIFSNPIRAALLGAGVPVAIASNPLEPLETEEGREFLALLKLIVNTQDHLAWRSILQVRKNGLGSETFAKIYEVARRSKVRFYDALLLVASDPTEIGPKGSRIKAETEVLRDKIKSYQPPPKEDVVGWLDKVIEAEIENTQVRSDVAELFRESAGEGSVDSLNELLKATTVSLGDKEQDAPKGVASIMTMHQAKGLTATAVFVAAAENEYIPGRAAGKDIDDERRLLYVSLTRARQFLFVTFANKRTGEQKYSGSTSGDSARHLTQFLSGGPVPPTAGPAYAYHLK
jgi:DNA helicase-2/ATP-dependent DNA helicase PcrA